MRSSLAKGLEFCLVASMNEESTTTNKLVSNIKEVIGDAEHLIRETASGMGEKAKEARQQLAVKLEDAKKRIGELEVSVVETAGVVRDKALEGAKKTDHLVRSHPYESIGIAFGVGLLIGVLINRKD